MSPSATRVAVSEPGPAGLLSFAWNPPYQGLCGASSDLRCPFVNA